MNWRSYGDTTLDTYIEQFTKWNSPMLGEAAAVWEAAQPHSALALAMLFVEQKYGTYTDIIPAEFHNPLSLKGAMRPDGTRPWLTFPTYEDGVRQWRWRITSETYGEGVYARTVTLADLIRTFAPPIENDTNHYIDTVQALLNKWPRITEETPPVAELNMTKGLIPFPGFADWAGTFTKYENVGMNRLGPRKVDVLFFHRALGRGAVNVANWLNRSDVQGLTDWVIDADTALMIRLVDIYGKGGDMTGWAQGPYRKPVPDLVKLTAKYGGDPNTINRFGESIEVSGFYDDPISQACKNDLALWAASRAHDRGIRWDRFPQTPDGYSFIYGHKEACGEDYKPCPGSVVWAFINDGELIEMARALMKQAQTGGTVAGTPIESPVKPIAPKYAKPKPIAALGNLELDDIAGISAVTTREGDTFRVVTDQVVAINTTPRYQIASITSKQRVGPAIKKGEDFNPAWEFTAKDGEVWYVTPYWTRVRKQDTRVVGTTPLKA